MCKTQLGRSKWNVYKGVLWNIENYIKKLKRRWSIQNFMELKI